MVAPALSPVLPHVPGNEVAAPFWGKEIKILLGFGGGSGEDNSKGVDNILMPSLIFGDGVVIGKTTWRGLPPTVLASPAVCCDNSKW